MTHKKEIDLFETLGELPNEVQDIVNSHCGENEVMSNEEMNNFEEALKKVGYTYDYGLDMIPYGLKKIEEVSITTYTIDIGPSFGDMRDFLTLEFAQRFIEDEIKTLGTKDMPNDSRKYWIDIYKAAKIYKVETKKTLVVTL